MKNFTFLILLLIASASAVYAEDADEQKEKFGIKFSGFIKNDFFYDSRQTISAREGDFLLFPAPRLLDSNGEDLNAQSNFNFLAVRTRLRGTITGPDAFGAKTSGLVEMDFFGQANDNINLLRLRHAFVKLNWEHTELLTGQYWNPMFIADCYPATVSFNTGAPIQTVARNPQIRVTHNMHNWKLIVAALAQRDYTNVGPNGKSSSYLRNSGIPDLHAQLHYKTSNLVLGGGIAYKELVPRLSSNLDSMVYKVKERVAGLSAIGFVKINTKPLTIKLQTRHGENIADQLAISGFAVQSVVNAETNERAYTPLTNTSFWTDIHTNGKKFQVGLFAGITINNGTKKTISDKLGDENGLADKSLVYGLGHTIESLYRISPRAIYNTGKLQYSFEAEYTLAAYGKNHDLDWKPQSVDKAENYRVLFSVQYFF